MASHLNSERYPDPTAYQALKNIERKDKLKKQKKKKSERQRSEKRMNLVKFLSAFFSGDDIVCIRIFSDRKAEDPEFRGSKYSMRLSQFDTLMPVLKHHNEKNRSVCFTINGGGHNDDEIIKINAQFVEMDTGTFEEQQAKLNAFPLPPSIVVKTRKSLHCYWLIKDAAVKDFREVQLALAAQFDGDTMCQNESRCMRLPGFYHCKKEPIMVECIKFEPELKYTQDELRHHLPNVDTPSQCETSRTEFKGTVGSGKLLMDKCAFCLYCKDNAASLSEPAWYAFITNMSLAKDGAELVHEVSKPYPKYSKEETDDKIRHAVTENKPHTCDYIKTRLGFQGCGNCNVKAPIAYAVLTLSQQADELAEADVSEDMIFDDRTIELMAYAKKNNPIAYGKFKQKLKGKCSVKDFEAAVNFKNRSLTIVEDTAMPLNLDGIDIGKASQPAGWNVSMEHGVQKSVATLAGTTVITVCPSPIVISRRFESVDSFGEKVEISFYRDNKWKKFIAPRSSVFNKSSLISCADRGLPVSSANAGELVSYLSDYENVNVKTIPFMKSTERLGWIGETSFFPYTAEKDICFESDFEDSNEIHKSLTEHGSFDVWLDYAGKLRNNPYGRFMLASSFASVLLEPLSHRVFFVNVWHDTRSGKSAACKVAVSVWGNPLKMMGSFNATAVGLERKADTLRNVIYGLDERQLANENRLPMAQIVYGLSNGFGRIRGSKDGGIQSMTNWRLIILSTAEEPLLCEDSHDGMNTRVMELHGQPVTDKLFGAELHHMSEKNYGFAGRRFIVRLCREMKQDSGMVERDYERVLSVIRENIPTATHLENAAVIALGDYYSDMWIWNTDEASAFKNSVETAITMLENNASLEKEDIISRAWQHITDWCVINDKAFGNDAVVKFGVKEGASRYYVSKAPLYEAMKKFGYPVEKCLTGFFERGYMQRWNGKRQKQKKNGGVQMWYYVIDIPTSEIDDNTMPLV